MNKSAIIVLFALMLTIFSFTGAAFADTHYVAELTVDGIKATATPEPTPVPTPEPETNNEEISVSEFEATPAPEEAGSIVPEAVTEPQAEEVDPVAEDMADPVDEPTLEPDYATKSEDGVLRINDRGEDVKALQQALFDKGYLSDEPDGFFGTKTEGGILFFQFLNKLPLTGEADESLIEFLTSDGCPDAVGYPELDFEEVSNNPAAYNGDTVSIYGRVLQTIYDSGINLRAATRGAYEDVVYIVCDNNEDNAMLKESDRVVVYGTHDGTFSYKNAAGERITIPRIRAELVIHR